MPGAFIAWSGARGREFAAALHDLLIEILEDIDARLGVTFSPITLEVGSDWRQSLQQQLASSQLGILILEPAAIHSSWVSFEAGFLAGTDSALPTVLFPIVLTDTKASIAQTPFELLHCADLSSQGIDRLLTAVFDAAGKDVPRSSRANLARKMQERLTEAWEGSKQAEIQSHDGLRAAFGGTILEYREYHLLQYEQAQEFERLIAATDDAELSSELAQIVQLYSACKAGRDVEFALLASDWALENLIRDARERLEDIARGKIPVRNRSSVRSFWRNIFRRSQRSIWTTNMPGPNMGKQEDPSLLDCQREAKERGVAITRLFVYEPDHLDAKEITERQRLMTRQLNIGIRVLSMSTPEFRRHSEDYNAKRAIGGHDFMLIDETRLYLTRPEESEIEADLLSGQQYPKELKAAKDFRDVLEDQADEVTLSNVERWPNIQGSIPGDGPGWSSDNRGDRV